MEFRNLGETGNVTVIVTVAVVLLCYIVVAVIARKTDVEETRNVRIQFNPLSPSYTRKLKPYRVMRPNEKNLILIEVFCRINRLRVPIIKLL